jgi:biopolymer transport protein ExbB
VKFEKKCYSSKKAVYVEFGLFFKVREFLTQGEDSHTKTLFPCDPVLNSFPVLRTKEMLFSIHSKFAILSFMENSGNASSLLELFYMGGIFMWPLLVFSIAACGLALERTIFIFYHNLRMDGLCEKLATYIEEKNFEGAETYLAGLTKRRPGARVLLTLIKKRNLSETRLDKAVETEALTCINSLENGFNFLTVIGSLAPLTGFLGTVSGMIGAFRSIAEATEVNAQIVANGIYEALITTVFGLVIAIVAMIAHSLLSNVVDKFASDVERAASEIITELQIQAASG